jgi:hypothetical protein
VLDNLNLLLSNFFVLLGLQTNFFTIFKSLQRKIFDASWILATCVSFELIFYLLVFYIHNFPFQEIIEIGFYRLLLFRCGNSLYVVCNRFKLDFVDYIVNSVQINLNIDYFTNNYQNGALSI